MRDTIQQTARPDRALHSFQPSSNHMSQPRYIAYYRVSTTRQGNSGLGLEAQRHTVTEYLGRSSGALITEITEIESGKRNDRPKLSEALTACRIHNATLLIAKLDRLARNAAFLLNLRDAGVDFIACDMPDANRLTVGIMALIAEDEAERISARTKAALAAAKARGVKLGTPTNLRNSEEGRRKGNTIRSAAAARRAQELQPVIADIQNRGATSLCQIAKELNARSIQTARGKLWSATQVKRLMDNCAFSFVGGSS